MTCNICIELSRSGTLIQTLIIHPAMTSDDPSNRQSVNTGIIKEAANFFSFLLKIAENFNILLLVPGL
jgi:hypothetical protein